MWNVTLSPTGAATSQSRRTAVGMIFTLTWALLPACHLWAADSEEKSGELPPCGEAAAGKEMEQFEACRGSGCPEEYLGLISGVHWFDVWKTCPNCFGGVIHEVPHSSYIPPCPPGHTCPPEHCVPWRVRNDQSQTRYGRPNETFYYNAQFAKVIRFHGFAVLDHPGGPYFFRLLTIRSDYSGDKPSRYRSIGVEIDPTTSIPNAKTATWTVDPPQEPSESEHEHYIDVWFGKTAHRFYVTSYRAITRQE
jgi:hypothetical protein